MITWREVATFGDLQRWLEEHDMAIGDLSRVYVAQKMPSAWKASVEPNNPANPIVAKLGATEEDFLERPHLCEVVEDGDSLEDALLGVLRKVDEMLGNVPPDDGQVSDLADLLFGPFMKSVAHLRRGAATPAVVAESLVQAAKMIEENGVTAASVPAFALFRERRFVELVARLIPAATQEYRDAVVEELFKK